MSVKLGLVVFLITLSKVAFCNSIDLTKSGVLHGDTVDFLYDEMLSLRAAEGGESFVYYELASNELLDTLLFRVRLAFEPSSSNGFELFILSDTQKENAFSISLGETGTEDKLRLHVRETGVSSELTSSTRSYGVKFDWIEILVVRSEELYMVKARSSLEVVYEELGSFTYDLAYDRTGIDFLYTSSRVDKIDVLEYRVVSEIVADTISPQLLNHFIQNDTLRLIFSEEIVSGRWSVNGVDQPVNDSKWLYPLADENEGDLEIVFSSLSDREGNTVDTTIIVEYYPVRMGDLMISEIMADPYPQVSLANCDYVELYNASNHRISLEGLVLEVDGKQYEIDGGTVLEQAFIVLTEEECESSFDDAHVLTGLTLPDLVGELQLLNNDVLISDFVYDVASSSGGRSLERSDLNLDCSTNGNISFSKALVGGTPGRVNTITETDFKPYVSIVDVKESWLSLQANFASDSLFCEVNGQGFMIERDEGYRYFIEGLESQDLVQLHITGGGECIDALDTILEYALIREDPIPLDLVVSKWMFDASADCDEFIEVYNNSQSYFDLSQFYIAFDDDWFDGVQLIDHFTLIKPGQTIALSNGECLQPTMPTDLPTLSDGGEAFVLFHESNIVLDSVRFLVDDYTGLAEDFEEVVLHRNTPSDYAFGNHAWQPVFLSETTLNEFYEFSPLSDFVSIEDKTIKVYSESLDVRISLSEEAWVTMMVYDQTGKVVYDLLRNELILQEQHVYWNDFQELKEGIYILQVEALLANGERKNVKEVIVLLGE